MILTFKKTRLFILFLFSLAFLSSCKAEPTDFIITFDVNGGTSVNAITTDGKSIITMPQDPEKEGHTFDGWYFDDETFNNPFTANALIEQPLTNHLTVYGKWIINSYFISFISNGGTVVTSISQPYGSSIDLPTFLFKTGYSFEGWCSDAELTSLFELTSMPSRNIALYAKWAINSYTITFDTNGGSLIPPMTQEFGSMISAPEIPTKLGHTFIGWILHPTMSSLYVFDVMPSNDITLYAIWRPNEYTIDYVISSRYFEDNFYAYLNLGEKIIDLSSGETHAYALSSQGRVFTWGYNIYGQLADGTRDFELTPTDITDNFDLEGDETITSISLASSHFAALTSTGRLLIWGLNEFGQLGEGTTINKVSPIDITSFFNLSEGESITQFSLGESHSSALTSTGRLFTWGWNFYGQLGDGTRIDQSVPTDITSHFNLSDDETITELSLGYNHSSALTSTGRLFTWGFNEFGQLGDGTTDNSLFPIEITSHFNLNDGEVITVVSLEYMHSSALTSDGRLFTWGFNQYGQLGDGTQINKLIPTDITPRFDLSEGETLVHQSLGNLHSSVLTSTGRLFTWGFNQYGQLAYATGSSTIIVTPEEVTNRFNLEDEETITYLSFGYNYSSALTSMGRIFTWGKNNLGQLGDGTINNSSMPILPLFNYLISSFSDTYDYNELITEYVPYNEGLVFSGWYSDYEMTVLYDFSTMPAENLILYGYWELLIIPG